MGFVELILAVHDRLAGAGLPHAFGGALALGYVADPRATVDIDVNVFVEEAELDRVRGALATLSYADTPERRGAPIAGIRFTSDDDPFAIDVFPSLHERYAEAERRIERHRFGPGNRRLPFLSAEDLCVFKLSFGRAKDWIDLAAIARARPELDVDYVEEQLVALRGPTMHKSVARLRALIGHSA